MSIASTDLKNYASASMPQDDVSTTGGAIDTNTVVDDMVLVANDTLKVKSANAGDTTQTLTVTGRDATGAIVSEAKTLNGTTLVACTTTFERILAVLLARTAAGIVMLFRSDGLTVVVAIRVGKLGCRRLFYDSASAVARPPATSRLRRTRDRRRDLCPAGASRRGAPTWPAPARSG